MKHVALLSCISVSLNLTQAVTFRHQWPCSRGLCVIPSACNSLHMTCWHRSGLRGAVGLALSLFVFLDDSIADRRFRVLTFFYMGAMAFLTLIIQGTTTPFLLRVSALAALAGAWCLSSGPNRLTSGQTITATSSA